MWEAGGVAPVGPARSLRGSEASRWGSSPGRDRHRSCLPTGAGEEAEGRPPPAGARRVQRAAGLCPGEVLLHREGGQPLTLAVATRDAEPSPTVAPIAQAARQALAGETLSVLPAFV